MIDTYIFDMDGTLVDSLPDLTVVTNMALESVGFPTHTEDEVRSFVGNGAEILVRRACPADADSDIVDHVLATWRQLYPVYGLSKTDPFPGMVEAVRTLKEQGKGVGVVSNKFDAALKKVAERYYPGLFDVAVGESKVTPRKPDPTGLLKAISDLGSVPERTVFVGDTHTDLETARNAGVRCIILSWGYERGDFYETCEADAVMSSAQELLQFAQENDI